MAANNFIGDGEILFFNTAKTSTNKYRVTGTSRALEANRISFVFDSTGKNLRNYQCLLYFFWNFLGPSSSTDCGFVGGLNCIRIACQSIKNDQSDLAIVFGGNTMVETTTEIQFDDLGWISKDGKVRVFDNEGNNIHIQKNKFKPIFFSLWVLQIRMHFCSCSPTCEDRAQNLR